MKLHHLLILLLFSVTATSPRWASYACNYPEAFLHVAWAYPPPEVLPLDINGGDFAVSYPGKLDTYAWGATYYEADVNTYHWYGYYTHPEGVDYTVRGYIRNQAGPYFVVVEDNWSPCLKPDIFVPTFMTDKLIW